MDGRTAGVDVTAQDGLAVAAIRPADDGAIAVVLTGLVLGDKCIPALEEIVTGQIVVGVVYALVIDTELVVGAGVELALGGLADI